jgi:hypothetical protein
MLRQSLIYGGLAGALQIGIALLALTVFGSEHLGSSELLGYLVMLLALGMIFVGIKRYRDRELGGVIRFHRAVTLGLGMSVVAGLIYVAAWEVNIALTGDAFAETYMEAMIARQQEEGLSGDELQARIDEMRQWQERYANPLFRIPVTFTEIFPVGLLVSLASAGLLRNPDILPART